MIPESKFQSSFDELLKYKAIKKQQIESEEKIQQLERRVASLESPYVRIDVL